MESRVATLLAKIAEQNQIIDKNFANCLMTIYLHLKSRLSVLEEKVFSKGESTVPINPDNNISHTILHTNLQPTISNEINIPVNH